MTLRLLEYGTAMPTSVMCDRSAEFQPGMIAELIVLNNQVVATVSSGNAPLGIIDDVKTKAFTNVSWNEVVIVPVTGVLSGGILVSAIDVKAELRKPNVLRDTFSSTVDVALNPVNGVVTFLAGTPLNIDLTGSGSANGIKAVVNYTYQIANVPGDDSTLGSDRVTIWYQRMFFATDMFETNQVYPLRANLYVSENGYLTTRKHSEGLPSVAMVTGPPTASNPMLEALWY